MADALVTNASDEAQVGKGKSKAERRRERELDDIKAVLSTINGRRFLWRLLEHCRGFESVWESSAKIHYNAGQQDVAHFLMAEISIADEMMLYQMMKEGKDDKKNG